MNVSTIPNISSAAYVIPGIKNTKLVLQKGGIDLFFSIRNQVCDFYNIDPKLLYRKSRKREFCICRQIISYLARQHTTLSFEVIGNEFKRNHATVIKMVDTAKNLIKFDAIVRREVEAIERSL